MVDSEEVGARLCDFDDVGVKIVPVRVVGDVGVTVAQVHLRYVDVVEIFHKIRLTDKKRAILTVIFIIKLIS